MNKNVKSIAEALAAKLEQIGRTDLEVQWTSTGGGCMALSVETKGGDHSEPYDHVLITGEDVYTEDEFDGEIQTVDHEWHFMTMGHYSGAEDGDMVDEYYVSTSEFKYSIADAAEFIDQVSENWLTPVDHAVGAILAQIEDLSNEDKHEAIRRATENLS